MLDLTTVNARDAGRLVAQAILTAQLTQANQSQRNTYQLLAATAVELIDIMRIVRTSVREIRDIWIADNLGAELADGTFDFTYMTIEQVMELMAGHAALLAFFGTEITVAEGITITPDTIISRTKPPLPNWGIVTPAPEPPAE